MLVALLILTVYPCTSKSKSTELETKLYPSIKEQLILAIFKTLKKVLYFLEMIQIEVATLITMTTASIILFSNVLSVLAIIVIMRAMLVLKMRF